MQRRKRPIRGIRTSRNFLQSGVAGKGHSGHPNCLMTGRKEHKMRTLILTSLLTGGLLFGASSDSTPKKVSGNERVALETQSPKVHISKKAEKNGTADKVVANKTTVVAHVPAGQK